MIIVVARYNEDLNWTKQFPNVIVYNKGDKLEDGYNEIFLKNVGREGHTYYKYICDNYDNLEDYTIFLQGRPFDHSPNIISNLNKYINNKNLEIDFEFLSEWVICSTLDLEKNRHWQCKNIHDNWNRVFSKDSEDGRCIFGAGAQFIVSKNKILKRPKEFYENIVKMLEYAIDPLEGYDIERFHKHIFE
jgi:hypothetical protein